jgi:hypothetical protein
MRENNMSGQNIDLQTAVTKEHYLAVLGGVMAMNGELYQTALQQIAENCSVPCDDAFKLRINEIGKSLPCDLD